MSQRLHNLTLLDGQTSANDAGYIQPAECANAIEFGFHIEFDHTSTAGQVVIETASDPNYAGTWAILATVNWAAIDKSHYVGITGAYHCMRARIASAVTSGKVTCIAKV